FAVEGGEGRGYAQVVVAGSFALHEWRALGQDGAPLAERRFEHCRDTELFDDRQQLGSDAEGRLALLVALDPEHESTRQRFALLASAADDARVAFASFELPLHSRAGVHDEGTLAFDRGELIVAGRVVDEHGDRLGNVALEVRAEPGSRRGGGFVAALRAGADGSFEVRDVASPRELRVLAWDREGGRVAAEGDGVRAGAGSRDVVVPMSRPAELRGRVVLPSGVAPESLRFQLTLQPPARGVAESFAEFDGERRLLARLTRRGNYRLDVLAESEGDPIATVGPFPVELGATVEPLELAPLDLSDRCRSLQVTVRRRDGSPVEGAVVWRSGMTMVRRLTAAGAPPLQGRFARRVAVADAAGRATLPIVAPAVDLVVVAPGCLPLAIEQVRDDLVVELEAQPTVRLDVAGVVAAGLDRAKLRVHLRPIAVPSTLPSELLRALGNLVVEADGEGELRAPLFAPGRFEARLYSIDGGSHEIGRGEFEVATLDGTPSVALAVDPERAAAAALAARLARAAREANGR
ncbi:MAG: hypothetical protein JNL90_16205, partial [Planctomycetes bacterium]|nr:hypothetical protein [Planctomycetota bacterium]